MSYGTNSPQGFQPYRYLNGTLYTGSQTAYLIRGNVNNTGVSYGTTINKGDLVTLDSALAAVGGRNSGTIIRYTTAFGSSAGVGVLGTFQGCQYYDANNVLQYSDRWVASTQTYLNSNPVAFVADDPNLLYNVQVVGGAHTPPDEAAPITLSLNTINISEATSFMSDLGFNYNLIDVQPAAGDNRGLSVESLDLFTQASTATLPLKLLFLTPQTKNNFGLLFNNGLVMINNHVWKAGTVGVS